MAIQWVLFAAVWKGGLARTGASVRELIGGRWASAKEVLIDCGLAVVRFLIRDFPAQFAPFAVLAICCWIAYFVLRHRLGTAKPPGD